MKQRIIIEGIPPSLNKIISEAKKHWSRYSRQKKEWLEDVYYQVLQQKPKKFTTPVSVIIELNFKDKRRHDPDNYTPKFIHDGLVEAGILQDDSFKQIQELTIRLGEERDNTTVIWIEDYK